MPMPTIANLLVQLVEIVTSITAPAPVAPPAPTPTEPPAAVSNPAPIEQPVQLPPVEERTVSSTAYCLPGPERGTVAMNNVPKGTRWEIHSGTRAGDIVVVADRIGWGSDFDLYFPSCRDAKNYGRQHITIVRLPD